MRLSSKFYCKSGQWSADFITVVRVHKPSSCPTDYTFCFSYKFLVGTKGSSGGEIWALNLYFHLRRTHIDLI